MQPEMNMNKAIVALLCALVALLGQFGITLPWLTGDVQQIIATVLAPVLVWAVPNRPKSA